MNLELLEPTTAPAESAPILDRIAADLGFVPNLAAVSAASPTLLAAFDGLRRSVADPAFPAVHREIAGVAVGVAVDNAYGVAFHSTMLANLGVDEPDIDAMRAGAAPSDPVGAVVYDFARETVLRRGKVSAEVIDRAHEVGLTDADLLQLVAECVFAGLVGTIDNLVERVPLDDFLRPRQWKAG
ncbi:MAG TPA: carboxymuconolactone decarboxylase family protein [Ilumatobacteraceae bacterium]